MLKKHSYQLYIFLSISASCALFILNLREVKATRLTYVSDTISVSWPATSTNHTVNFKTTTAIPASGKIVITPEAGDFTIPAGFDFNDIDLATSSSIAGNYTDRLLAAATTAQADGVSVVTGSNGSLTFTLNSTYGIVAGDFVKIELGTNATSSIVGNSQFVNPSNIGPYKIEFQTLDASDHVLDHADTYIVVIEPVAMSAALPKVRSNGSPTGYLSAGTVETILSLNTNYLASCRYATTTGVDYYSMSADFTNTGQFLHSVLLPD